MKLLDGGVDVTTPLTWNDARVPLNAFKIALNVFLCDFLIGPAEQRAEKSASFEYKCAEAVFNLQTAITTI